MASAVRFFIFVSLSTVSLRHSGSASESCRHSSSPQLSLSNTNDGVLPSTASAVLRYSFSTTALSAPLVKRRLASVSAKAAGERGGRRELPTTDPRTPVPRLDWYD